MNINLPNFFCSQSSGMAQYEPVGSTDPKAGILSRRPNRSRHLLDANSPVKKKTIEMFEL